MTVQITTHAYQRLAERWHLTDVSAARRFVQRQLAMDTYVIRQWEDSGRRVVWTPFAEFLMEGDVVITVLPVKHKREIRHATKKKNIRRAYRDLQRALEDDPYYWRMA